MVANPKTGKVLATRCPQSECKLYIDLVLGTTEKQYQDALDEAKKLEPQHPEHLSSLDGLMASHALGDIEDEDDQEEEVREEEEAEVHE